MYPLIFRPILKSKVWGGRALERFGKSLPEGEMIGESWEVVDLDTTSAGGGGGNPERSVVSNGEHAGKTLHELIEACGSDLMGDLAATETGCFPLLVKYLDANDNLSVQVHPSQSYADTHDDAFLKSEAWYIVDAEPGAVIYKGIKEGTSPDAFRAAIEANRVENHMIQIPVKAGDCHYLPSGTCHALGAGIVVAEVQTPSDTTFRVYDWGRTGRQLHVEQAMACIDFRPTVTDCDLDSVHDHGESRVRGLVLCEFFRMDELTLKSGYEGTVSVHQPMVWMVINGSGTLRSGDETHPFKAGETILLPACMDESRVLIDQTATMVEVRFPQAESKVIA